MSKKEKNLKRIKTPSRRKFFKVAATAGAAAAAAASSSTGLRKTSLFF